MLKFEMLHPRMTEAALGDIPSFLDAGDPRPAAKQIDANYRHGGGWHPQPKFKLLDNNDIHYPGDPPLDPLAQAKLRDELIVFYRHAYVAIIQPDRTYEVARVD